MKTTHWVGVKPEEGNDGYEVYPADEQGFSSRQEAIDFRKDLISSGVGIYRLVYMVVYEVQEANYPLCGEEELG